MLAPFFFWRVRGDWRVGSREAERGWVDYDAYMGGDGSAY